MELASILKPIIDFIGGIRVYWIGLVLYGDSHNKIKGPHMRAILNTVQPGDLILRRFDNYVSSWFIKGRFSHVGLFVGDDSVIHVGGDGIKKEDLLTFIRADDAAIIRPIDENTIAAAIEDAYTQLGRGAKYDYLFDAESPEKFYCSEFTDYCYGHILKHTISSKGIIYPDDYLRSKHFQLVWEK